MSIRRHPLYQFVRNVCALLQEAFREFRANDPLRMAAATSFFASFALPPIMIILVEVLGFFSSRKTVRHYLFTQLSNAIDQNISSQVRSIQKGFHDLPMDTGLKIAGFLFLLFVATTLFEVIKNSLNQLWKVRLKPDHGFGIVLLYRARSIGIIMVAGILFTLVFLIESQHWINVLVYYTVTALGAMFWFTLILKYQADATMDWQTAGAGGIFTGALFIVGDLFLQKALSYKSMLVIYGASTSLTLLLLFVFYCSFIFYFGACFTLVLGRKRGKPVKPSGHATSYAIVDYSKDMA